MVAKKMLLNLPLLFVAVGISISAQSAEIRPEQETLGPMNVDTMATTIKTKDFNSLPVSRECTSGIVPRATETYQYVDALLSTFDLNADPYKKTTPRYGRNSLNQAVFLLKIMLYKYQGESPTIAEQKLKSRVDEFQFVLPTEGPIDQISPEVYETLSREYYSNLLAALTNDIDSEIRRLNSVAIYSKEVQRVNNIWLGNLISQKNVRPENVDRLSTNDLAELRDRQRKFEVARCNSIRSEILANDLKYRRLTTPSR